MLPTSHSGSSFKSAWRSFFVTIMIVALVFPLSPLAALAHEESAPAHQVALATTTIFSASFDSATDGFSYQDDTFLSTNQPNYASGTRAPTGGYGGTGGLQVALGGVDANVINGMSGGWRYSLNLASAQTGVSLSFRYKVDQTATYEFDEYSRFFVSVNGVLHGRGSKNFVDHIGGDGSSSLGNSSTYLPTTEWQQHQVYVGNLAAGNHTIILGGYNNKKNALDESTTVLIDDVVLTAGNAAPVATDAQTLTNRVDINQFLNYNRGIAAFHDRCRGASMGCSSTDYTTNYYNALAWVETQLQGMGYTTARHNFNYNGSTGTNLYATKLGTVTPTQMYMISGHLDARSSGDGFDDDGSAVALLLETARVLASPDVTTDKSVRIIFWDKEEVGLHGAYGYVQDRRSLQGTVNEPTWLGLITHDMILYDHGAGTRTTQQSAYADLDVEFRAGTTKAADSQALALKWAYANGNYAPDYPATAYNYSTNTDDTPFHPYVASVSVRENRRSLTSGDNAEWINPYYHTVNDIESSYARDDDGDGKRDDIELGYNAVRTTLGLVADLAGARIVSSNNAPTATPQSVSTAEDTARAITLTGSDADGDPLTYSLATSPAHGTLSGTAPNLTYTPAANYNGADSFTFTVNDGKVNSTAATVSITLSAVNDAPVANAQSVTTAEDTAKAITLTGSDVDGNPLTYNGVSTPAHGTLTGTAPNLTYTPAANYNGTDSFTFKVNDGTVDSAVATVSLTVTAVNDMPVANAQAVTTTEDTAKAITLTGSDIEGSALSYSVVTAPARGTLSGTSPNLTYTPAANYNGTDSFTFKVNDGTVDSAVAIVSITVSAVNDAPVANAQSLGVSEDSIMAITLSGSDAEGSSLTFSVTAQPAHGTLSGTAPNLSYAPAANYSGADAFQFVVNDGTLNSAPATISIAVNAVNDPPIADGQALSTYEDAPLPLTLTGADIEAGALTYSITAAPSHGSLSGSGSNLTYTPAANYNGNDGFTFVANDGQVNSAPADVSIAVLPVNDTPVANGQSVATQQNTTVAVTLTGSDIDGDVLSYAVVADPAHGTLSGSVPNLTYTPAENYNGSDSFTFKVNDGTVDSAEATVTVTIAQVNTAPTANGQAVTAPEDTPLVITLTGSDPENSPLTFAVITSPVHGTLSGAAPNLTYTPAANYNGADSFTFVVNDGIADSTIATVSLTLTPVNDAPVANPQSVTTSEDGSVAIALTGADVDGDTLSYSVTVAPGRGTLSGTAPNLTYTPEANYNGADSFTFVVNDGAVDSATATVSLTVSAVNDAPVANAQAVTTAEDTAKAITLTGSDVDGGSLTFTVVSSPAHGALTGSAPNLTYTPAANYNGADAFTFKVSDGVADATAIVSISVTAVNDAPVANPQAVTTNQDAAVGVTLGGSDVDGNPLTYAVVTGPTNGTLSGAAPALTYTPNAGYSGADNFTFKVNDGTVDSPAATVSITVNASGPTTVFFDDFETNKGWTVNPSGSDTATLGKWERANPESTSSSGTKQQGTTVSGSYDLVTGPLAGSSAGAHDVDGGVTTVRSPNIALPAGKSLTLTFSYYMAHLSNSSSADYLRVKIVGATTTTVLQELGATNDDDAAWAGFSGSLNAYAGQTVYLLIEAADASGASLVEAAVDDVKIVAQ